MSYNTYVFSLWNISKRGYYFWEQITHTRTMRLCEKNSDGNVFQSLERPLQGVLKNQNIRFPSLTCRIQSNVIIQRQHLTINIINIVNIIVLVYTKVWYGDRMKKWMYPCYWWAIIFLLDLSCVEPPLIYSCDIYRVRDEWRTSHGRSCLFRKGWRYQTNDPVREGLQSFHKTLYLLERTIYRTDLSMLRKCDIWIGQDWNEELSERRSFGTGRKMKS